MSTVAAPRSHLLPIAPHRQPGASAMPAARPPIYVLDRVVGVGYPIAKPGEEWWEIPCASKKAYGCGEKIQGAVEGLALYARLGDGPLLTSSLAIRMSPDAHRVFELELKAIDSSDLNAHAVVEMAEEQGVTVIVLSFRRSSLLFRLQRPLTYYLVYDATDRSLSMFQIRPGEGFCTRKPIVPIRADGGSDYKLLLLGREVRSSSHKDVFWVGSLSSSDPAAVPCKIKRMDFPPGQITKAFKVDVAFSFQGKGFWGDLEQGLVFCDLQTSSDSDMDFGFVKLPCECEIDEETGEPSKPVRNTRTLGCVGDNIWFVCIDTPSHNSDTLVCIWKLHLPGGQLKGKRKEVEWEVFDKIPAKVLWELPSFKESGLPAAPFRYPILTPDGALCFLLIDRRRFPRNEGPLVDHFCSFDICYKRFLWHGLVHNYQITESVIMYPSTNFIQMKSFVEDHPAAGLKAVAGREDHPAAGLKAVAGGEYGPAPGLEAMVMGVRKVVLQFEAMARGSSVSINS